ncbi:hypothetical protein cypCar_00024148 [Cyprinus carpio]|nr:hypothetical protein cypCar_00024148 [Cyprinus carpio]
MCVHGRGKTLSGNLCISKEEFAFVPVRIDVAEGACGIRNIRNETKHIILACEQIISKETLKTQHQAITSWTAALQGARGLKLP